MYIKSEFLGNWYMLQEIGKIKNVLSVGKGSEQEVSWGLNCDFLGSGSKLLKKFQFHPQKTSCS